eukprot:gene6171-7685_t
MSQQQQLRYPKGFNAYPHSMRYLEGYGMPKGYITLIGVTASLATALALTTYFKTKKRPHVTRDEQWKAVSKKNRLENQADPIYQIPKEKF